MPLPFGFGPVPKPQRILNPPAGVVPSPWCRCSLMPFRPARPPALWTSCHADEADARRHVSTETWELAQVVFFTTIAWSVPGWG
jgi:hypothetical protein